MVSKYYKISHKSLGNNSFKSFQLYLYLCSLFSYLLTYLTNYDIWKYYLKGEMSLSAEMEIIFYRAVALWKDEISDGKHEEISSSSDSLFEKKSKGLWVVTFLLELPEGSWQEKQDHGGTPEETVDISSVLHRSLRDQFVSLVVTGGFSFEPIINADSFSLITKKRHCRYFITLIYHINIFNAKARHFNLLLPRGNFCSVLLYYQATKKAINRLDTRTKKLKRLSWVIPWRSIVSFPKFRDHFAISNSQ